MLYVDARTASLTSLLFVLQAKFWKLRQSEVEGYALQYSPLKPRQGDLTGGQDRPIMSLCWGGGGREVPGGGGLPSAGHTQRSQASPTAGGPRQSLTSEIRLIPISLCWNRLVLPVYAV